MNKLRYFILLGAVSILFSSCFKKGCRDIDAINYDEKAKRNDQSCVYYTKMKVSSVSVLTFSSVNSGGLPWDTSDDPDCFIRLRDNANNIMHQSTMIPDQYGQLTWTVSPAITITDFYGVTLQMRDHDADYTSGGSDLIVEALVPITDHISGNSNVVKEPTGLYPDTFEFSQSGATFQFTVSWE